MAQQKTPFHLGICMAGAVTAGSYTAGVLDYMLETLDRWQEAKDKAVKEGVNNPEIPMYDLQISVISGASAGGMCAAISTSMMAEGFSYEQIKSKQSKLYKTWIELDDQGKDGNTILGMLKTHDLKGGKVKSLLNSKPIENIAHRAITQLNKPFAPPPYINPKLDTLLTIGNLKGATYDIEFKSFNKLKKHRMIMHRDFMHFKLNSTAQDQDAFLGMSFENRNDINLYRASSIATGAFPVALLPIELERSKNYYYNRANKTFMQNHDGSTHILFPSRDNDPPMYTSYNIDGGTFNNEPFGETEQLLSKACKNRLNENTESHNTNRAIIMIDPFPSNIEEPKNLKDPSLATFIEKIIGSLRGESLFRPQDIIDAYGERNYLKYLITPQNENREGLKPLCCMTLGGFGGFLSRDFREHDYQVGRRNCQQFLRMHLRLPYSLEDPTQNNPIHADWSPEAIKKFLITVPGEGNQPDSTFLPIIPDIQKESQYSHNLDNSVVPAPKVKKYTLGQLKTLEKPLEQRMKAVIKAAGDMASDTGESSDSELVEAFYRKNWFGRAASSVGSFLTPNRLITNTATNTIAKRVTKQVITTLIKGLEEEELISK